MREIDDHRLSQRSDDSKKTGDLKERKFKSKFKLKSCTEDSQREAGGVETSDTVSGSGRKTM